MKSKSIFNSIICFTAELTREGSNYIALFIGVLLWAITQSILIGVISALACALIFSFLIDKTIKPKEQVGLEEEDNNPTKETFSVGVLLLIVLLIIVAGSSIAYFIAN